MYISIIEYDNFLIAFYVIMIFFKILRNGKENGNSRYAANAFFHKHAWIKVS